MLFILKRISKKLQIMWLTAIYLIESISILKDAVNGSEGIDACIALMSIDKQHTQEWFDTLNADPNIGFYPDLIESLAKYYGLNTNKPQAKNFAFWQRRNDNV